MSGTPFHPDISPSTSWELRSILLLWLSLMMTVPFNLAAFDGSPEMIMPGKLSQTAEQVKEICYPLLYKPSKEGEYAALVLAKLFTRPDCIQGLSPFLEWVHAELDGKSQEFDSLEAIFVSSVVPTLCRHYAAANHKVPGGGTQLTNVLRFMATTPTLFSVDHLSEQLDVLYTFQQSTLRPYLMDESRIASESSLLRKMSVKAEGRWWKVKLGSNRPSKQQRHIKSQQAAETSDAALKSFDHRIWQRGDLDEEDYEPPDGFEDEVSNLLESLSDKVSLQHGLNGVVVQSDLVVQLCSVPNVTGHYRSVLCRQIYCPARCIPPCLLFESDLGGDHLSVRGHGNRAGGTKQLQQGLGPWRRYSRRCPLAWGLPRPG